MIYKFKNKIPKVSHKAFVAKSADIIGEVSVDEDVSIWFGAVVRGDNNSITIKKGANIQDKCILHVTGDHSIYIGEYSSVGHNAIVHGCKIGKHSLIGMGSTILDGAEIGDYTIIGAASLVTKGKKIPSGVLCMGSPAKVIRNLTEDEIHSLKKNADNYIELSKKYKIEDNLEKGK